MKLKGLSKQNKAAERKNTVSLRLGHEEIPVVYLSNRNLGIPHRKRHYSVD